MIKLIHGYFLLQVLQMRSPYALSVWVDEVSVEVPMFTLPPPRQTTLPRAGYRDADDGRRRQR